MMDHPIYFDNASQHASALHIVPRLEENCADFNLLH